MNKGSPFERSVVVETREGTLRGRRDQGVLVFRGIPYAAPPLGSLRFREIRSAPTRWWGLGGLGENRLQDGTNFARTHRVVVVQCNHRLGLMGFLCLSELLGDQYADSGNPGLLDILAALHWVNRNIAGFGGNPDNVFVCGESGGGAKTSCVYAMPRAAPYFHKASTELGQAHRTARWVLDQLGLKPNGAHRLVELSAEQLLKVQLMAPPAARILGSPGRSGIGVTSLGGFGPVVDGTILPNHPFDPSAPALSRDKPLLVGYSRDEVVFFDMLGDNRSMFSFDWSSLQTWLKDRYGAMGSELLAVYRNDRPQATPPQIYVAIESDALMGAGTTAIAERKAPPFPRHSAEIRYRRPPRFDLRYRHRPRSSFARTRGSPGRRPTRLAPLRPRQARDTVPRLVVLCGGRSLARRTKGLGTSRA